MATKVNVSIPGAATTYFIPGAPIQKYLKKYDKHYKGSNKTDMDWASRRLNYLFSEKQLYDERNTSMYILDPEAAQALETHTIHRSQIRNKVASQMTIGLQRTTDFAPTTLKAMDPDLWELKYINTGQRSAPSMNFKNLANPNNKVKLTKDIKDYVGGRVINYEEDEAISLDILVACVEEQLSLEHPTSKKDTTNRDTYVLHNHKLGTIINQLLIHKKQLRGALGMTLEPANTVSANRIAPKTKDTGPTPEATEDKDRTEDDTQKEDDKTSDVEDEPETQEMTEETEDEDPGDCKPSKTPNPRGRETDYTPIAEEDEHNNQQRRHQLQRQATVTPNDMATGEFARKPLAEKDVNQPEHQTAQPTPESAEMLRTSGSDTSTTLDITLSDEDF